MARGRPESGKERLLEAALKEFSERGFRKTTLDDVAQSADVSKGTLYNYFSSKEEMYDQACDHAFRRWDDWACSRAEKVEDPREKLRTLARELYYYLADHQETKRLLQRDPNLFPIFGELTYRDGGELDTVKMLRSILTSGIKQGIFREMEIDRVIRILGSVFRMFVIESYIDSPERSENQLAMETLAIVIDGLQARQS